MELFKALKRKLAGDKWTRNGFEVSYIEGELMLIGLVLIVAMIFIGGLK